MDTRDKLCVIYNFTQKYRTAIFKKIDSLWDCRWIFGNNSTDIKGFDPAIFRNVAVVENMKLPGNFYYQKDVYKDVLESEYDTVLMLGELFCVSTWAVLLRNRLKRRPKRIFLWSHGWYGREGFIKRWLKRMFFGLADGTFLYGNYAREIAIEQGMNPDRLWVIHNSLDHDAHLKLRDTLSHSTVYQDYFKNDNPTLIFIGRLTKVKKLDRLIRAVHSLKQRNENYNIMLVGDGEERSRLEELSRELNVDTWFYGGCYDDALTAQLLYDADLCVSPGNVGLTAMHTMTFGTPVLTHSNFTNQMPEFEAVKSGITGAFFREGDISDLAEQISLWFETHPDRDSVRKACYKEIDTQWTPEYQLEVLESVIKLN